MSEQYNQPIDPQQKFLKLIRSLPLMLKLSCLRWWRLYGRAGWTPGTQWEARLFVAGHWSAEAFPPLWWNPRPPCDKNRNYYDIVSFGIFLFTIFPHSYIFTACRSILAFLVVKLQLSFSLLLLEKKLLRLKCYGWLCIAYLACPKKKLLTVTKKVCILWDLYREGVGIMQVENGTRVIRSAVGWITWIL